MEQLGINPTLLITQVINFLILLFLLSKFVYKPILRMLAERKDRIEKGLELTRKMEEEQIRLNERKQLLLQEARSQANTIINEAERRGEEEKEAIINDARKEAQRAIEEGFAVLAAKQEEQEKRLRKEIGSLVIRLTERLLSETMDEKMQKKIVENQLQLLQKVDVKQIH